MKVLSWSLLVLLVTFVLCGLAVGDPCGKRQTVKFGSSLKSRGRPPITIKQSVTVMANNGVRRVLNKDQQFYFCGCDKGGVCVIYGDKAERGQLNADGTTFYCNIPARKLGLKSGKNYHGRARGTVPLKAKTKKVVKRRIISTNLRTENILWHGPGAPMWEYTWLANGRFVTGAETPASLYKGTTKIGKGYNTGLFIAGKHKFYDVCAQVVKTRVRPTYYLDPLPGPWAGPGEVEWVLGYVPVQGGAKVWAWMIQRISMNGRVWTGNVA
jgi:hypothetical protein